MATIDAVAGRGAAHSLPPVKYPGGTHAARPDSPDAAPRDVVQVSEAARSLASGSMKEPVVELQLSPEQLRKLMTRPEQPAGSASTENRVES